MMLHLALVLEIMAVIVCIHRLYGQKVKLDIGTVGLYFACLLLFEAINIYGLKGFWALGAYVLIGVYCIRRQKESVMGAALSIALMIIIIAVIQFLSVLLLSIFFTIEEGKRTVYVNLILLGCIMCIPQGKLQRMRMMIKQLKSFNILMIGFAIVVVSFMVFQERLYRELHLELFLFAFPAVVMVFLMVEKWHAEQSEKQDIEKALQTTETMQSKYEELLKTVRMQQHEFKNHLAAIISTQFIYESYEKLVQAQNEYCGKLIQESRYYNLLGIGDNVLAGFLYGKFQEIEAEGIAIEYQVKGSLKRSSVSSHHLVEMVGILLDNAAQAVNFGEEKSAVISFSFLEEKQNYEIIVRNRFPYVSYDEITGWFQIGKSTKGEGRGIGLYHMKCLCEKLNCGILCRSIEIEKETWIEFTLKIEKADR
jgi:hypothetical protein